jgi:hypothetical protein
MTNNGFEEPAEKPAAAKIGCPTRRHRSNQSLGRAGPSKPTRGSAAGQGARPTNKKAGPGSSKAKGQLVVHDGAYERPSSGPVLSPKDFSITPIRFSIDR